MRFKKSKIGLIGKLFLVTLLSAITFTVLNSIKAPINSVHAMKIYGKTYCKTLTAKKVKELSNCKSTAPNGPSEIFIVPNEYTKIAPGAFKRSFFKKIILSPYTKELGDESFKKCRNLEYIEIPSGCKIIGKQCFKCCTNLKGVDFLLNAHGINELNSIGEKAFSDCIKLEMVIIPSGCEKIGESCFEKCSNLKNVYFLQIAGSSLTTIEDRAFKDCSLLEGISIPDECKCIGANCFDACERLKNVFLPEHLTSLQNGTFVGCSSLENISIPDDCKSIGCKCFSFCIHLKNVTFSSNSSLTSIKDKAFENCPLIMDISVPSSFKVIGNQCFKDCKNLKRVELINNDNNPVQLNADDASDFNGCLSLFEGCSSLERALVPAGCKWIGGNCFRGCSDLTTIEFLGDNLVIGNDCLKPCKELILISFPNANTVTFKYKLKATDMNEDFSLFANSGAKVTEV